MLSLTERIMKGAVCGTVLPLFVGLGCRMEQRRGVPEYAERF